ncbi:hypothetical protein BDR07DRAFT_1492390 [Suillus spraguei]|nr:hypothetical protein BDR07DRAFT_1492390 [Suillus spraguei]
MSYQTSQINLSMERFHLDGMMVASVFYGIYLLLTMQAWISLMQRPRNGEKIAEHRLALLFYVFITFALGSISFGVNIKNSLSFRINVVALSARVFIHMRTSGINAWHSGHVQDWFMQALLLYRCCVIWNWSRWAMIPMITLYIAIIGLSIIVQFQASTGASFYNITIELAYLCIQVGLTVTYTVLVTSRLFVMRGLMKQIMSQYDSSIYVYDTIALMVIESAALYLIFAIILIVAFGMNSNGVTTLCFLSIGKIQGIAQLFIIIHVARGRAITREWSTRVTAVLTSVAFAGTVSEETEVTDNERIGRPEQDVLQLSSDPDKAAEVAASIV